MRLSLVYEHQHVYTIYMTLYGSGSGLTPNVDLAPSPPPPPLNLKIMFKMCFMNYRKFTFFENFGNLMEYNVTMVF